MKSLQIPKMLLLVVSLLASACSAATPSEVLRSHGLPIGLLPKDVLTSEFAVDEAGQFRLLLSQPCTAKFETSVHYNRSISGVISYGQIASISGVSAQELFLWLPVRGIRVDVPSSGLIYFDVGVIHKQFSLSLFESPPECQAADDPISIDEGDRIARLVAKSRSGKLRYEMDRADDEKAWFDLI